MKAKTIDLVLDKDLKAKNVEVDGIVIPFDCNISVAYPEGKIKLTIEIENIKVRVDGE